jgi:hypothetical protein
MVVNDLAEAFAGAKVEWSVESQEVSIARGEWTVDVPSNDVSASRAVALPFKEAGSYTVNVEVCARDGKSIGKNVYRVKAA